jgi:hypothetical protein
MSKQKITKNGSTLSRGENFWKKAIQSWEASGISQSAFCRKTGLNVKTLNRWNLKLKHKNLTPKKSITFIQLPLMEQNKPESISENELQLYVNEQYRITVSKGFGEETLQRLLKVLNDKNKVR